MESSQVLLNQAQTQTTALESELEQTQQSLVKAQLSFERETALRNQLDEINQAQQQLVQQTARETPQLTKQIDELTQLNAQLTQQLQAAQDTMAAQANQISTPF